MKKIIGGNRVLPHKALPLAKEIKMRSLIYSCKRPFYCQEGNHYNCELFKLYVQEYAEHDPLCGALLKEIICFVLTPHPDAPDYEWGDCYGLKHNLSIVIPKKIAFFKDFLEPLIKKDGFLNVVSTHEIKIDNLIIETPNEGLMKAVLED